MTENITLYLHYNGWQHAKMPDLFEGGGKNNDDDDDDDDDD
jgi:hypothetical protein